MAVNLPPSWGKEGPAAKRWEDGGSVSGGADSFSSALRETPSSHAFGAGPSFPDKRGRFFGALPAQSYCSPSLTQ